MPRWTLWFGAAALVGTGAVAMQSSGTMPDMSKSHHPRSNCHGAYDLLNADVDAGRTPSVGDRAWARLHEDAALAGKPCPPPPATLATRAADRSVSTGPGIKMLTRFTRTDPSAVFEAGYGLATGTIKLGGMTPMQGAQMIRQAADMGDAHAQYVVGAVLFSGEGLPKPDKAGAFPFYAAAAKAGHLDATFMLGAMYMNGLGTKKDAGLAFDHLSKAAAGGHVFATYLAASMALNGEGVKQDFNLAYRLARNLADQGEVSGAIIAASALLQQKRATENEKEVLYWMDVAARDGDATVKAHVQKLRPQVVAIYQRVNAPPEYRPRVRKLCPMKTVCYVSAYSGSRQSCTTNKDYWNDCNL
ncbi:tetratricopeptide repeat protein [Sphingomonas sp.]|jgi:hypothetical protein|uniref:tetratricopeptide repeat protein n=1 Tax=Sphingomonas sp. TaxID=28214 RepID=UPI002D7EA56A|nr:tetratricopeptide repeat protein [Sphingomonas sp.]HEU0043225.1 tetratricopeptide repeat protein [Sphingomonas sp.]